MVYTEEFYSYLAGRFCISSVILDLSYYDYVIIFKAVKRVHRIKNQGSESWVAIILVDRSDKKQ